MPCQLALPLTVSLSPLSLGRPKLLVQELLPLLLLTVSGGRS
jgi:hypothetical protein